MKPAAVLKPRVRQDIQARTDKLLRELGNPPSLVTSPPEKLAVTRRLFTAGNLNSSGLQTVSVVALGCVFISPQ